jgi:hypothetical protein
MGVEYRRYLIPRPNTFRPQPNVLVELVQALRRERWLADPTSAAFGAMEFTSSRTAALAKEQGFFSRSPSGDVPGTADLTTLFQHHADNDLQLGWPVDSVDRSQLRYPLTPRPFTEFPEAHCYYEFELHLAKDLIYHTSEVIEPFAKEPTCACGTSLVYSNLDDEVFFDDRIACHCPRCGAPFDTTGRPTDGLDGWTAQRFVLPGGATYRFAIVVDCGKCFADVAPAFDPALKSLIETVIGAPTYEVPDIY